MAASSRNAESQKYKAQRIKTPFSHYIFLSTIMMEAEAFSVQTERSGEIFFMLCNSLQPLTFYLVMQLNRIVQFFHIQQGELIFKFHIIHKRQSTSK
jgi:hypothetical protein